MGGWLTAAAVAMGRYGMALLAPLALLLLAAPSSAAVLPNTDWRDSLIADFPLRELGDGPRQAANLTACVALCRADRECVAVAWNPAMGQAQCQLKCAARPDDRFTSPNTTGVIVRPNNATSCPRPSFVPPAWQADITAGTLLLAGPNEPAGHVGKGARSAAGQVHRSTLQRAARGARTGTEAMVEEPPTESHRVGDRVDNMAPSENGSYS